MWRRCFFKKEFLEDSRCSSQKRFISSSSVFLANSRPFFTVSDASTQEDIWIRYFRCSNGFAYPFRTWRSRSTQDWTSSAVICWYILFLSEDLWVVRLLSVINIERLFNLSVPNALPCTVPGEVLYPVNCIPWFRDLFMVCSTVWYNETRLKQIPSF